MARDDVEAVVTNLAPMWEVTYTYFGYQELDLKAMFYIRAPDAITAIQRGNEALPVMFTERARHVMVLRSVERHLHERSGGDGA